MAKRGLERNTAAHRVAQKIGLFKAQMRKQGCDVIGHGLVT